MPRLRHICAAAVSLAIAVAGGCTEEAETIHLSRVPLPAGGSADSISMLHDGDRTHVVAPVGEFVFSRQPNRETWERHRAVWPEGWKQTAASPLDGVRWSSDSFNFPSRQRFTTHGGRIWMLTYHQPSNQPQLLVSADRGASWSTAPLPERHRGTSQASPGSDDSNLSRMGARVPLRLSDRADGLYLLDKQHVWRAVFEDSGDLEKWETIEISEIDVLGTNASTALPTVVRNYLPPAEDRDYELLTIFGDRLYVYRRHRESDRWLLVSTLPTVDLDLYAPEGTQMVYLLAPQALYRSAERGERWEKSTLTRPPEPPPQNRAVTFVQRPDRPDPSPPAILVGTQEGGIYRSTDGGSSWTRVRPPDPDSRAITGLTSEADSERVWVSTEGLGVLLSRDGGHSWTRSNNYLRATRPLAVESGLNNELVLGTRSGLFRLTGAPEDGHWDPLHQHATSAVEIDDEHARIISGTVGGAILTDRGSGEPVVSRPLAETARGAPLFQPWNSPPSLNGERAILDIQARPNSEELFAWSRERGPAISTDGGTSWRAETLNRALESALHGSLIDDFVAGHGETLYLASHGFAMRSPDQLWRSPDNGSTWSAIATFPATDARHPVLLRRRPSDSAGTIHFARGGRLNRSVDGGDSWREIPGPWATGTIRAFRVDEFGYSVVFNIPRATRAAFARDFDPNAPQFSAYTVVWPEGEVRPRSDIRDTLRISGMFYLMTDRELYVGRIPQGETQLPNAPAIIGTLVFVFVLASVSFWYLRFKV